MTILVSNANGKVGQEVVRGLLAAGQSVRVGARNLARARAEVPGAEVVEFDVTKAQTLAAATNGVESVFASTPYELLPEGEERLVQAAQGAGVRRFVKMSALGAEADPSSPHSLVEAALARSSLGFTLLRPTFFMQNYATLSAAAVRAGAIYEPAADGASAFIDTRDIAAVAVAALTQDGHEGKAYALTGPRALTRAEVAAELSKASGRDVKYVAVDDAALRAGMAGAPPSLIELMSVLFSSVRQGHTAAVSPDVQHVLGRPPRDFTTFAADYAQAWR